MLAVRVGNTACMGYIVAGVGFAAIGILGLLSGPAIGRFMHAILGERAAESAGWKANRNGRFPMAQVTASAGLAVGVVILWVGALDHLRG